MSPSPLTPLIRLDPVEAWAPWSPAAEDPWSLKWAGHLYRHAAFGGTWTGLQEALLAGPESSIDRLLSGGEGHEQFDRIMDELGPEPSRSFPRANANNYGGLQD